MDLLYFLVEDIVRPFERACIVADRNSAEFDRICEYFSVVYEDKRTLLIMLSRFIRGAGMGLGASGIVFTVWFFFSHLLNLNICGEGSLLRYFLSVI
ncbi:hypothetical protein SE957_19600 [Escherichia coli]|nr:hypothetical protein [Escherichia coli]